MLNYEKFFEAKNHKGHLLTDQSAMQDLFQRLHFGETGGIWFNGERSLLLDIHEFSGLLGEIIGRYGLAESRAIFTRIGYQKGVRNALLSRKVRAGAPYKDMINVGPQLYALMGFGAVHLLRLDINVEKGAYFCECLLEDSIEAESYLQAFGHAKEPVCWLASGHASGFCSTFLGRGVLFREMECKATGAKHCRLVGKPIEAWGEEAEHLLYDLRPETFVNRLNHRRQSSLSEDVIGSSSAFNLVAHLVQKVAPTPATVLFLGETGVGKEVFARLVHQISPRSNHPFIAVNCGALPENLVETELFGVEKGAYTGAVVSRPGRFERAHGGTLFLDEIGNLPWSAQSKLLRVLQTGEIERVGGIHTQKIDVRIIAATNENLQKAVKEKRFRDDLYFRLTTFPIRIPPLRERRDDIPLLIDYFLARACNRYAKNIHGFTEKALSKLLQYDYPGNVRELEQMIERGVILAQEGKAIDTQDLFLQDLEPCSMAEKDDLIETIFQAKLTLPELEEKLLARALLVTDGNYAKAARLLGLSRPQVVYRAKKEKTTI
jgi:DNA-binding NtrC family response regulator